MSARTADRLVALALWIALWAACFVCIEARAQGAPPESGGGVSASTPSEFPDGSESAPSITNSGDTNTGAWFCAADAVCISTGGTERFRLTTSSLTLTVPALLPSGSANSPSWGWSADNDGSGTGAWRPFANEIQFVLNGTARLYLTANQVDPGADATSDLGQTARRWRGIYLSQSINTDTTDSTGSPGAATINKPSGKSAIANGASSVVITNNTVAATSRCFVQTTEPDATCTAGTWTCVAGSGSFTVTAYDDVGVAVNCTAATNFDWIVVR